MVLKISCEKKGLDKNFDIELYISNKNIKKELLKLVFLNNQNKISETKYKIDIDSLKLYTYNSYIVNKLLNICID